MDERWLKMRSYLVPIFLLVLTSLGGAHGLYEDQVGRWDWMQRYVGAVKFVNFGVSSGGNIIVATQSNVLASLNSRTGKIVWRKLLEEDQRGSVQALSLRGNAVIVTGDSNPILRSFLPTGALNFETKLPFTAPPGVRSTQHFIDPDDMRVTSVYLYEDHVVISDFSYATQVAKNSPPISATFLSETPQCTLVGHTFYVCLLSDQLKIVSIAHNSQEFVSTSLDDLGVEAGSEVELRSLPEGRTFSLKSGKTQWIVEVTDAGPKMVRKIENVEMVTNMKSNGLIHYVLMRPSESACFKLAVLDHKFSEVSDLDGEFCIPDVFGAAERVFVMPVLKKDSNLGYRVIVVTEDVALMLFHKEGRVLWSKEEALSMVSNVQFVDLPLSEIEAQIEEEFTETSSDIVSMFIKRISSQLAQVYSLFEVKNPLSRNFGLVRDKFGFHKVILVATRANKFFLIDNMSGEILWSKYVPEMKPFNNGQYIAITQRSTAHFPHPPVCTILGAHPDGGSYVLSINPITGQIVDERKLKITISQHSILQPNEDFLKGILLFDSQTDKAFVYPETLRNVKNKHYLLSADKTGSVKGFLIEDGNVDVLWTINLAMGSVIESVSVKNPAEQVHSQGRVLGDRTVLYKYINPNLAAVVATSVQQSTIYIYLIDVVTGAILYQTAHRKAKGPVHVVHSENWLVYSFINEKSRRQEISCLDLYEGFDQPNDTFSSFSSILPKVEHSTFILPDHIVQLKDTVTEKGITSKYILAANAQGSILEIPKAMLDPRRPVHPTMIHREEGLIPYVPEILVPAQNTVNYNQSVSRMRGIETAPSGLESTCLVLAYGLDIYYTRVAPSQNFDILKDNFDHVLICVVLVGLVLASYITKALAARKALKAVWK